jgi:hypothetical protein
MKGRQAASLFTATLAVTGAVWAWWFIDPTAPQGPALPAAVSALLAANVALTLASCSPSASTCIPASHRTRRRRTAASAQTNAPQLPAEADRRRQLGIGEQLPGLSQGAAASVSAATQCRPRHCFLRPR